MKKIFLLSGLLITYLFLHSQILKKITDNAKEKVNNKVDKTIEDTMNGKKNEKTNFENKDTNEAKTTNSVDTNKPASFKSYSKYDFVSVEKNME